MTFAADIKRWSTVTEFAAYLQGYDPAIARWADGVTLHHTYTPTLGDWRGFTTVKGTRDYYIYSVPNADGTKGGWTAGPHLFIAHGSPRAEWDGIYQLTPLNIPGIHAGKCNSHLWGIEVVGRYDLVPWSSALAEKVYGVVCALLNWRGLPANVKGHRECLPNKSCPGNAIKMDAVRAEVARRLSAGQPTQPTSALLTERSTLFGATLANKDKILDLIRRRGSKRSAADIRDILDAVFTIANTVGIPAEIVVAQQFIEASDQADSDPELEPFSSYWSQSPRNNLSGYGVTGTPGVGVSFPTPLDAVQAEIGRLLRYFLADGVGTEAQQALMKTALKWRPLDRELWGSATQLAHLGAVRNPTRKGWASPGPAYGQHIADVANMLRGL